MSSSTRVEKVKPGTLDAILCGKRSFMNAAVMLKEVQRVLKTGGIYIAISYGNPQSRFGHFVGGIYSEKRTFEL